MFCIPPGPTEATCPVGVRASQSYLARAVVGLDCKSHLIFRCWASLLLQSKSQSQSCSLNPQQAPCSYPVLLHCRAQRQLQGNWKPWWYQHRPTTQQPAVFLVIFPFSRCFCLPMPSVTRTRSKPPDGTCCTCPLAHVDSCRVILRSAWLEVAVSITRGILQ